MLRRARRPEPNGLTHNTRRYLIGTRRSGAARNSRTQADDHHLPRDAGRRGGTCCAAPDRLHYDLDIWKNFHRREGAAEGRERRLFVFRSVEEVRPDLLAQWSAFPVEYITLINHYTQTPQHMVTERLTRSCGRRQSSSLLSGAGTQRRSNPRHEIAAALRSSQ